MLPNVTISNRLGGFFLQYQKAIRVRVSLLRQAFTDLLPLTMYQEVEKKHRPQPQPALR